MRSLSYQMHYVIIILYYIALFLFENKYVTIMLPINMYSISFYVSMDFLFL